MPTNSPRLKIPKPAEGETPDVPRDLGAVVDKVDAIAMSVDVGPLSSRPPSSPASPGTPGHAFVVTDQALTGPRLDVDTGTGFVTVGPAPVDAAANVPSSRTLGPGANQACAGNDPRLVGGAAASGDVTGQYPGPISVNTWNGQSKAQVVASAPPQAHGSSHLAGSTDPIVGITDTQIAAANKDGPQGTPGMRTLGTGAQQACAGNDPRLVAPSPIGAIVAYAGSGDPPETDWLIADGRLIDKTTYAEFFNRVGHSYNGNVDPGGNKVRIPDKRGRKSVGALNMGTGAPSAGAAPTTGGADNSRLAAVRGTSYGEVNHTLLANESGVNGNGGTNAVSIDHFHSVQGGTAGANARHAHSYGTANAATVNKATPGSWTAPGTGGNTTGTDSPDHAHSVNINSQWMNYTRTYIDGSSAYWIIAPTLAARNADSIHNNIDPCEADSYIVRVL